jgi:hypothetical protein
MAVIKDDRGKSFAQAALTVREKIREHAWPLPRDDPMAWK